EQELRRTLRQIRDAIDLYKQASDEGRIQRSVGDSGYPKKLEDLAEGVDDQKSPKKMKIYFLRRIPRDPLNADPTLSAAATWGKRSCATRSENTTATRASTRSRSTRSPRRSICARCPSIPSPRAPRPG